MIAFLPAHSVHMPALAKNRTLDRGEDHSRQSNAQVLPVLKVKSGQMCSIVRLHPRGTSSSSSSDAGAIMTRVSSPSSTSAAASSKSAVTVDASTYISTVSAVASTAAVTASSTEQLRQSIRKERSHVPPTIHIEKDGFH